MENMQNNMHNMHNMQKKTICKICNIICKIICKICKIICKICNFFKFALCGHLYAEYAKWYAKYAKYANQKTYMQNMHCPVCWCPQAAVTYWMTELELELEIQDVMSDESQWLSDAAGRRVAFTWMKIKNNKNNTCWAGPGGPGGCAGLYDRANETLPTWFWG